MIKEKNIESIAILGSSGAIGRAFASKLSLLYPDATIYAFSRTPLSFTEKNIIVYQLDYEKEESIKDAALSCSQDRPFNMVIVATGILHQDERMPEKSICELTKENLHLLFEVNTVLPAMIAKHFLPRLSSSCRSIFALLSARIGSISDNMLGGWYSYRASKAALNMVIKTAAIEYARINKQAIVVGLHPGTVDSKLSKPFQKNIRADTLFSPDFSVQNLLKVINGLDTKSTGKCFAWDGSVIEP
ncbi:MAG: hypothetical protein SP4CHLAM5_09440 [Chlamydiia bacterium]|nr:hypothetical protein [Chlamydiia bacterium]MCH9618802.1 hypothetical protein [Chlamydiia bacterium]MCH9624605.1 hypothetical protein [Chlamydiia bacterium]